MPDSPSIMTDCASSMARATRAMRVARLFSTPYRSTGHALCADPLGSGASLTEATAGEDEPGVPVAIGGQLGVSGVEWPDVVELYGFASMQAASNGLDGVRALGMWKRAHMVDDCR